MGLGYTNEVGKDGSTQSQVRDGWSRSTQVRVG